MKTQLIEENHRLWTNYRNCDHHLLISIKSVEPTKLLSMSFSLPLGEINFWKILSITNWENLTFSVFYVIYRDTIFFLSVKGELPDSLSYWPFYQLLPTILTARINSAWIVSSPFCGTFKQCVGTGGLDRTTGRKCMNLDHT